MNQRPAKLWLAILSITVFLLLELGTPPPGRSEKYWNGTVATNVNLRQTPSLKGRIVSGLLKGTPVKIYEEKDGWFRVSAKKYHQVFSGWVSMQYVEISVVDTPDTPPVAGEPKADFQVQAPPPVETRPEDRPGETEAPVQIAAAPEKPFPQPAEEVTQPAQQVPMVPPEPAPKPEPEPEPAPKPEPEPQPEAAKPAVADPPQTKKATAKTKRPARVVEEPAADAAADPADDLMHLIPMALPALAVVVLLIAFIAYRVKRKSGKKTAASDLPAAPVEWPPPPPAESQPADEREAAIESEPAPESEPAQETEPTLAESRPIEAELPEDFAFQMESETAGGETADDIDSLAEAATVYDDVDLPAKAASVYDEVMEIINRMSDVELTELLGLVTEQLGEKSRQDDRLLFYTTVDYVVEGQYYRDFIQDLSVGGVFIKARQMFEPGQSIKMTFMAPYFQKPFKISGEIVRVLDTGIGVEFDKESPVQEEALNALIEQIRTFEETG